LKDCDETYEFLAHVLGACPHENLLIFQRHHHVRSMIAQCLRGLSFEVDEEVSTLHRRLDNREKK